MINPIKSVTYTCPVCQTSIKFNIKPDFEEMSELFQAVDNLICPKCKEDLSFNARNTFNAIKAYNDSVTKLEVMLKESEIILG